MNNILVKTIFIGFILVIFAFAANAQNQDNPPQDKGNIIIVGAKKTLSVTGEVAYIIVKGTAKASWETTKFTAKNVAAPVAKAVLIKAVPKISLFLLKQTGNAAEKAAPIALKAAVTYLKL